MAPRRDLEWLKAAQREDAERFAGELRHGWFWRKLHVWTHRFDRLGKWLKALLTVVAAGGGLLGAGAKIWQYIAARRVAPAELPATGQPTVGTDFVSKPKPPGT